MLIRNRSNFQNSNSPKGQNLKWKPYSTYFRFCSMLSDTFISLCALSFSVSRLSWVALFLYRQYLSWKGMFPSKGSAQVRILMFHTVLDNIYIYIYTISHNRRQRHQLQYSTAYLWGISSMKFTSKIPNPQALLLLYRLTIPLYEKVNDSGDQKWQVCNLQITNWRAEEHLFPNLEIAILHNVD